MSKTVENLLKNTLFLKFRRNSFIVIWIALKTYKGLFICLTNAINDS